MNSSRFAKFTNILCCQNFPVYSKYHILVMYSVNVSGEGAGKLHCTNSAIYFLFRL